MPGECSDWETEKPLNCQHHESSANSIAKFRTIIAWTSVLQKKSEDPDQKGLCLIPASLASMTAWGANCFWHAAHALETLPFQTKGAPPFIARFLLIY
jgi:hypothetical protein